MEITTIAGTCLIKNKKILLLQHSTGNDSKDGLWGPPAGRGENNEKLLDTAIRETKEEANLDVEPLGIVESGLFRASDGKNYLIILYLCKAKDLNIVKVDGSENVDFKWVSPQELISGSVHLRHPVLFPMLLKALNNEIMPLNVFKDMDIKV